MENLLPPPDLDDLPLLLAPHPLLLTGATLPPDVERYFGWDLETLPNALPGIEMSPDLLRPDLLRPDLLAPDLLTPDLLMLRKEPDLLAQADRDLLAPPDLIKSSIPDLEGMVW